MRRIPSWWWFGVGLCLCVQLSVGAQRIPNGRFNHGLDDWHITGNAWGVTNEPRANSVGRYHAESRVGGEEACGVLSSFPFQVSASCLYFLLNGYAGNSKIGRNVVQLVDAKTDRVLLSTTPPNSDGFSLYKWNLLPFVGRKVYFRATDGASANGYAWLGLANVHLIRYRIKAYRPGKVTIRERNGAIELGNRYLLIRYDRRNARLSLLCLDASGKATVYGPQLLAQRGGMGQLDVVGKAALVPVKIIREGSDVSLRIGPFDEMECQPALLTHTAGQPNFTIGTISRSPQPQLHESDTITISPGKPYFTIARSLQLLRPASSKPFGAYLALFTRDMGDSCVFFGGGKGCVLNDGRGPVLLHDSSVPLTGIVSKYDLNQTLLVHYGSVNGARVVALSGTTAHSGIIGEELEPAHPLPKGGTIHQKIVVYAGWRGDLPSLHLLKATTSSFNPAAERFIFWTSIIGTARSFAITAPNGKRPTSVTLQATAARLATGMPQWMMNAYSACWIRDIAHGWMSSSIVAGDATLNLLRNEIVVFAERCRPDGWVPTWIDTHGEAAYGNEDAMAYLIDMAYLYTARTGDRKFLWKEIPALARAGNAIRNLLDSNGLPVVKPNCDTWPDMGLIKGEQTYLAAVCYEGLRHLSTLLRWLHSPIAADRYDVIAERIRSAANRDISKGGLWDQKHKFYIGWRTPAGHIMPPETSGNLVAIGAGMCQNSGQDRAILSYLDAHRRYIYQSSVCPDAYTVRTEPHMLNQWLPWIAGWDVLDRIRLHDPLALYVFNRLMVDYRLSALPFREGASLGQTDRNSGNAGRIWDSWGLLAAIYQGQFGISMTPAHLRIYPQFILGPGRKISNLEWHRYRYNLTFHGKGQPIAVLRGKQTIGSLILPPGGGDFTIKSGTQLRTPLLHNASDDVRLDAAKLTHQTLCLSVKPAAPDETLTIACPAHHTAQIIGLKRGDKSRMKSGRLILTFGSNLGERHLSIQARP